MASATGLYHLRENKWDHDLREFCSVREDQLSPISDLAQQNRQRSIDLRNAKISTAIGDGAASNLGCGANVPGQIAINVGTSAAVRMTQPHHHAGRSDLPFGLFRHVVDEKRAVVGGAVSNAGNLRTWCLRELRLDDDARQTDHLLSRASAAVDQIMVLPFWVNERAPSWPEGLRGTIVGLTQTTRAPDILRAITLGVFYRVAQILELIEEAFGQATQIIVSGGVLHSPESVRLLA